MSGKITDSKGSGINGAVIVITDTATGSSQRVVTGADGTFTVTELPSGSYRVEVEALGARRTGRQNVEIMAGSPATVEIVFDDVAGATAGTTGTVEIRATSPTVQTDSAEVSRQYGTRVVRSLPIMDRQSQELIGLMPGVTPPTYTQDRIADPQRVRTFNVNGQPDYANVYVQDGAYATEAFTNNASRVQPLESIQSLNIRTSNYNAEYGFAGGSWTNNVTRPGTNGFHGSLFAFNTNSFFATRNPVNAPGNPNPRFVQNQFGGTAGGSIIPNRLFIFGSYDGALRRGSETIFATVPTADLRQGNFSAFPGATIYNPSTGNVVTGMGRQPFPGGTIPANRINPTSAAILSGLPLPNQPGLVNNLVGNVRQIEDNHRMDGKIDHRFSDRTYGFFRYGFTHGEVERGSLLGPLGDAAKAGLRNHSAVAAVSVNLSNTMLGEFRLGFNRYRNAITPMMGLTSDLEQSLGLGGFQNGLPQINIAGFSTIGNNFVPKSVNNTWNPATNWIWHNGIHRLKFGAEAHVVRASGFDPGQFSPLGTFTFGGGSTFSPAGQTAAYNPAVNAFAGFLLGAPSQAGVANFTTTPTWQQTRYAGYVTDTLNLWQRLYLELGVRYDFYTAYEPRFGNYGTFNSVSNTFGFNSNVDYDYNNFAPRVGLAFRPVDRLVFRAGYGMHYFPAPISLSPINLAALGAQTGLTGSFYSAPFVNPTAGNSTGDAASNFPYAIGAERTTTPLVHTYSAMIQADMGNGFLFDVGYVGTMGRFLPYRSVLGAQPGAGVTGLPLFAQGRTASIYNYQNGANNNYNSMQVNLTKRFAAGLAFAAAYTWSRAMDTGSDLVNPFDRNANYARSDYDRQHVLALSHVWNLPFGAGTPYANQGWVGQVLGNWELNGILRWATGTPYTVTADPLFCNCPGIAGVPANFVGNQNISGSASFDPSFFSNPSSGQFGTLGRNALRGPDLFSYNLSLFRNFPIRENVKLEFRGEAYNLTNTTNLVNPIANLNSPGFGNSFRTFNGMGGRTFQVAGRILF